MTTAALLNDLSARGVLLALDGDSLDIDAPVGVLADADIESLRSAKPDIIRLLRLAEGLPVDDDDSVVEMLPQQNGLRIAEGLPVDDEAAIVLAMDEVDAGDVPVCATCGSHCDTESIMGTWRCSACDPGAESRRCNTERWLRAAAAIRYNCKRHG